MVVVEIAMVKVVMLVVVVVVMEMVFIYSGRGGDNSDGNEGGCTLRNVIGDCLTEDGDAGYCDVVVGSGGDDDSDNIGD